MSSNNRSIGKKSGGVNNRKEASKSSLKRVLDTISAGDDEEKPVEDVMVTEERDDEMKAKEAKARLDQVKKEKLISVLNETTNLIGPRETSRRADVEVSKPMAESKGFKPLPTPEQTPDPVQRPSTAEPSKSHTAPEPGSVAVPGSDSPPPTTKVATESSGSDKFPPTSTIAPKGLGPDDPLPTTEIRLESRLPKELTYDDDDDNDDEDEDEDEDKEDKWSPSISRKRAGLGPNDLRLVGTVKRWKEKKFLMADGPKNSAKYRICKSADMAEYDDGNPLDLMESRFGEVKEGSSFLYGKSHAKTIQGVAWVVDKSIMAKFPNDFPEEVDLVKPKYLLPDLGEVSGKSVKMKVVDCVVKVKWLITGKFYSSWESRQTVRRIWGVKKGDEGIYSAAQHQEELFEKWATGKRPGRDQSATPFRGLTPGRDFREETPAPTPLPGTQKKVQFQGGPKAAKLSMKDWKEDYCDSHVLDPADMTEEEKAEMKEAWKEYKNA